MTIHTTINRFGDKYWYKNNKLFRRKSSNGTNFWYKDKVLHREDGPAIEWISGLKDWYYKGREVSKEFIEAINTKAGKILFG